MLPHETTRQGRFSGLVSHDWHALAEQGQGALCMFLKLRLLHIRPAALEGHAFSPHLITLPAPCPQAAPWVRDLIVTAEKRLNGACCCLSARLTFPALTVNLLGGNLAAGPLG